MLSDLLDKKSQPYQVGFFFGLKPLVLEFAYKTVKVCFGKNQGDEHGQYSRVDQQQESRESSAYVFC